jgi:hypothetical protein
MLQSPIEAIFICKIGDLALYYDSEGIDTLFQLFFSNREDDALVDGANALRSRPLGINCAFEDSPETELPTRAKEKISEGLLTGPLACASGLLHIQLPACFPTMLQLGGI